MTPSSLVVLVGVGLAAGWIASRIVRGQGASLFQSLAVGVLGAFVGPLLLGLLETAPPAGILGSIVTAVVGAAVLLLVADATGSLAIVLVGALVVVLLIGGVSISVNA